MSIRDFKTAANLFLDTVATFTSYELMDYKRFVSYTVLCSMIALERPKLREKVSVMCVMVCLLQHYDTYIYLLRHQSSSSICGNCQGSAYLRYLLFMLNRLYMAPRYLRLCIVYPTSSSICSHCTTVSTMISSSHLVSLISPSSVLMILR